MARIVSIAVRHEGDTNTNRATGLDVQAQSENEILEDRAQHPYPMSPEYLYTGRLVARFLRSFLDDKWIWGEWA